MRQGIIYAVDLIKNDPIAAITIIIAVLFVTYSLYQSLINYKVPTIEQFLGIGLLLYFMYVVKVVGDFMSGRFWTAPFFMAILLLNGFLYDYDKTIQWDIYFTFKDRHISYLIIIIGFLLTIRNAVQTEVKTVPSSGIADERGFYLKTNTLLHYIKNKIKHKNNSHYSVKYGLELKQRAETLPSFLVIPEFTIGMRGFYSGTKVIMIDQFALSDPLLARLPVTDNKNWRIGHFTRQIPEGYLEFHQTGSMAKMQPALAEYYKPLHYIISGSLFNWERIKTIWMFNNGKYDDYLHKYLEYKQ